MWLLPFAGILLKLLKRLNLIKTSKNRDVICWHGHYNSVDFVSILYQNSTIEIVPGYEMVAGYAIQILIVHHPNFKNMCFFFCSNWKKQLFTKKALFKRLSKLKLLLTYVKIFWSDPPIKNYFCLFVLIGLNVQQIKYTQHSTMRNIYIAVYVWKEEKNSRIFCILPQLSMIV